MDSLVELMNKLLAETYMLSLKSHSFHWNVEDPMFPMYHEFFGEYYEEVYGAVDKVAEEIRALDGIPVNAPSTMLEASSIKDAAAGIIPAVVMVRTLSEDNAKITSTLNQTFNMATKSNQQGLANYLSERIDAHQKHAWMFRAMLKRAGATNEQVETTDVESKTYEITFNK